MTGQSAEPSAPFVHTLPLPLTSRGEPLRASLTLAAAPLDWLDANSKKFLHPDEVALVTDRLHARRRHGLLVGRYAAKRALAGLHPEIDPRALAVRPGVLEQPVVSGTSVRNLGISLSHAGPVALAVAFPEGCPMGIDVERVRTDAVPLLVNQSPRAEQLLAARLDGPEPERQMRLWCLKEALSKALRCGLTVPLELLAVGSVEPDPAGLSAEFTNFAQYRGLSFVGGDLAAALVMPKTVGLEPADWTAWRAALAAAAALEARPD
ncbi:4'-phosphopantetheinyl transferase superfamily protein [Methylobacterium sp. Leaf456]|uniref:4'-phosphopantetheinyl transferase family protein n=1 Tax=Methylobacterium sp. Leaf456 TaxID=1736382 RepID=UPI0012E3C5BB|nr:4'-phosphopantetheinyl transferase superfamily protein [Methylobacterium sp. Leaf456]